MRGVVFDLDGTLVDSYAAIAESLNHARSGHGLPPLGPDVVRRSVGRGLESLVADLIGPGHVSSGVRMFRERYAEVYADKTVVLHGVAEALRRLSACALPLAVASNKPARFGDPILQAAGLRSYFVTVQGPDRVGSTKPDPAMLRACLTALDVEPAAALYVGDMLLDVETADRADVAVALVEGGSSSRQELIASGRPVLRDLVELAEQIEAANA